MGAPLPQRVGLRRSTLPRLPARCCSSTDGWIEAGRSTASAVPRRLGAGADVVDLRGGLLPPGFVDAHVHPSRAAWSGSAATSPGCRRRARTTSGTSPTTPRAPGPAWILGGGWAMAAFPGGTPTAADLDAVVPDRPVFLPNRDHHGAWVNTRALEIAGIDAGTPDPPTAASSATPDGSPTGMLHEGATRLVSRHLPRTTGEDYYAALLAGQRHLHSLGITSLAGRDPRRLLRHGGPGTTYAPAAARGELTGRWSAPSGGTATGGASRSRSWSPSARPGPRGRFRATTREDHAGRRRRERHGRAVEPYLDRCGHADGQHRPLVRRPPRRCASTCRARRGTASRSTSTRIGDRGVREALDAFEGTDPARATTSRTSRSCTPTTSPRFAALGVAANMQALWACLDDQMTELTLPFLGAERAALAVPLRRPAPRGRPAGRRQRLAGQHPRPARRDPRRGATAPRTASRAGRHRALPARAGARRSRPRSRRTPRARRGPTTATTPAPAGSRRCRGRPGGPRPRPVRRPGGRDRGGPDRVDVGRRECRSSKPEPVLRADFVNEAGVPQTPSSHG